MQGLFNLALALLPLANAIPQYPGVVICDSTPVTDYTYNTKITEEVTGNYGDKGWVNYDAHTCQSNGEACQRLEGTEVTQEISVSFGLGAAFDMPKALSSGLDFGLSVAWSTTKSEGTQEPCPGSDEEDIYKNPCVCGLQYKAYRQRATGTRTSTTACGKKVQENFNVTSQILIDAGEGKDQSPHVEWRSCRSSKSKCQEIEEMDPCADGL